MKNIWHIWISSVLLPWSVVSGHPCNIDKMGRAVCSGKSLLHPPNFLPRHITILDLSFNSLTMPRHGPFLSSFPSLHSLNLSSNSIPTLSSSLFCNLGALRLLDLSSCDISYVHRMSFRGLKSLHSLHLNNNKLQSLDLSIFPASGILLHLDLQNNELPCRRELVQLNVQRIHHIKLQGNPSVCSDSLTPFQQAVPEKGELQTQEIRTSDYETVSHRRKLQFLHIVATKKPSAIENARFLSETEEELKDQAQEEFGKKHTHSSGRSQPKYFKGNTLAAIDQLEESLSLLPAYKEKRFMEVHILHFQLGDRFPLCVRI